MTGRAIHETRRYQDEHGADLLGRFAGLLAIPSASDDAGGLDRNAIWIRDALNDAGARAAVTQVPGAAPVVFGRIDGSPGGLRDAPNREGRRLRHPRAGRQWQRLHVRTVACAAINSARNVHVELRPGRL